MACFRPRLCALWCDALCSQSKRTRFVVPRRISGTRSYGVFPLDFPGLLGPAVWQRGFDSDAVFVAPSFPKAERTRPEHANPSFPFPPAKGLSNGKMSGSNARSFLSTHSDRTQGPVRSPDPLASRSNARIDILIAIIRKISMDGRFPPSWGSENRAKRWMRR